MKRNWALGISIAFLGFFSLNAGLLLDQSNIPGGNSTFLGNEFSQSFTSGEDGFLAKIIIYTVTTPASSTGFINLFEGNGIGGNFLGAAPITVSGLGVQELFMTSDINLTAGNQYTFNVVTNDIIRTSLDFGNNYAGGHFWSGPTNPVAFLDSQFQTYVNSEPPSLTGIPEPSTYALLVLGLTALCCFRKSKCL